MTKSKEGFWIIETPKYNWEVQIPKQKGYGGFVVNYEKLTIWQRIWMRFIGWRVKKLKD